MSNDQTQVVETEKVSILLGGERQFRENVSSGGYISRMKWDMDTTHRVHILKIAYTDKTGESVALNKLPSWVFVEDVLGTKVGCNAINVQGDVEYHVDKNVQTNLKLIANELSQNTPQVISDSIDKSILFTKDMQRNIQKDAKIEIPRESVNTMQDLLNIVLQNYDALKKAFIRTRVSLRTISFKQVDTGRKHDYRSGVVDKELPEEEYSAMMDEMFSYKHITDAMVKNKFEISNPDLQIGTETYQKALDKYKMDNRYITIRDNGVMFAIESLLRLQDGQYVEVEQTTNGRTRLRELCWLSVSRTRFNTYSNLRRKPNSDEDFDIVTFEQTYANGKNKQEQGKNVDISAAAYSIGANPVYQGIPEEEIFAHFKAAIREDSYKKIYGTRIYSRAEFVSNVTSWIRNNISLLSTLKGEDRDKLNMTLVNELLSGTESVKEAIQFVENLGSQASVVETVQSTLQPAQQPMQPAAQQTIQQPMRPAAQQTIQQPMQQPVQPQVTFNIPTEPQYGPIPEEFNVEDTYESTGEDIEF